MVSFAIQQAMARAIALAAEHHPHPNPRVGAVILSEDGTELGAGAHAGPGLPHAERSAIADAGRIPPTATMVVTLEPCDHTGRTPPCTDSIIEAGIARVVVGALDPDEQVDGSGVDRLRREGVEVDVLDPESELGKAAIELDPGYFHHRRHGLPQVLLKLAATLDGQTAAADGTSRWITGPAMRRRAHEWRAACDAVMVGSGTVIEDDPRLDVRLDGYTGPQPRPVVVAGSRVLPDTAAIWEREPLVITTGAIEIPAGETLVVPAGRSGGADLRRTMELLGDQGILRVLVEGGSTLATSLMADDLVDIGLLHLGARLGLGLGTPLFEGTFDTIGAARDVEIDAVELVDGDVELLWRRLQV